ncbi:MAG: hypothetical protein V3U18_09900 [Alphaproteobacteria bacterium]
MRRLWIGAALVAAFLMLDGAGAFVEAADNQPIDCKNPPEEVKYRLGRPGTSVDRYGPQGAKVLGLAFERVFGEPMKPADEALVFSVPWGPLSKSVFVVLFRERCVVGWGPIPKQIYLTITAGRGL